MGRRQESWRGGFVRNRHPAGGYKLGDVYSSAKSRAGRFIGRGSSVPVVGGWFRGMAAPLINSSADRDAKKLEDARKKTRILLLKCALGFWVTRWLARLIKICAMSIANDKVYEKLLLMVMKLRKRGRNCSKKAVSMLAGITEGRDKMLMRR